ncbi:EARP and GARP complex-interacting protein 1 isoform X2 [Marmota marmota marmota]|uniref:EARP and GARP complex-interacting protein 1 isoform X2 n=1 Tax=Marmota marmota marmota TaxID=9994 RepID=UPI002092CBDA|nr:EARP and GARP complex-interacting protein 1 isoform X2 [Marmota marmota marmota]
MSSCIKRVKSGTLVPALQIKVCWQPATVKPPTAESRHVQPCGGCPRSWSPEARSPPTTLQAPPSPWSCSVTWTTQPMAMWPVSPGSRWEMGRRSSPWPTTSCCCGTCRRAPGRLCQIYCIENAHGQLVRDLDFNPNKQYYLASCGDDCKVKFWDTRNVTEPVKTLEEHSHWVWSVRYNHSHDQLVLTGSSDSRVILSNMVSISSEPFGHLVDDDDVSDPEEHHADEKSKEPLQDNVIATYEEHEDSVYAVDWSSADPWLFASLSYDGRLVINRVPRALKYHILL